MKSAVEIAMEKSGCSGKSANVLTGVQKARLEEEKNITKGKIAEAEIMFQSELKRLEGAAGDGEVQVYLDQKREELIQKKRELTRDLEIKIREIKE